jgi:2-polyprenyl-6-methoxyphenol hydroxylase-like FAD-dependent oxidoreductase
MCGGANGEAMTTNSDSNPTVLVVGAGPVGLTMAAHLHRHGVVCRIIDKSPTATDKSKALAIWARSLEMLEELGIVERFTSAGLFLTYARIYGSKRNLAKIPFTVEGTKYPQPLMLAQSETERLLAEHLQQNGIKVERAVELLDFADKGGSVEARLRRQDGTEETIQCSWLIGCDGAHSTVRKKLGAAFEGSEEPNDWLLADCRIDGPIPQDELTLYWHAHGVMVFFPFEQNRCRVIADMGKAQGTGRPADPTLPQMQGIVDDRGPPGVRLSEPHWLAGFRIHERKVARYGTGRCFLAGDAAHIHSPAGGQGMNTGMQDTYNLAWKIALVQAGRGQEQTLLNSYLQERGDVGEIVLRQAGRMTRMAIMRNPVAQMIRNLLVPFVTRLPAFRRSFLRYLTELSINYPHSPLNGQAPGGRSWSNGVRPGDRIPDVQLREPDTGKERRLLEVFRGTQHDLLLVAKSPDARGLSELDRMAERIGKSCTDLVRTHLIVHSESSPAGSFAATHVWLDPAGAVAKMLGARDSAVALVRPDGYLGLRGQPAALEPLVAHMKRYLNLPPEL